MWPLIIAAAAAAAQAYQSAQAQGANQAQLDKMRADFQKLVPPNYDMSVTDPPEHLERLPAPPNYDMTSMTPEQFKVVGQYKPEAAQQILEKAPQLVQRGQAGQEGQQAQLEALRKMRGIASSDFDPELASKLSQASRQAQTDAQSRQQSILTDMARRGAANSGIAAALQGQAGAQAMDREAGLGQDAAAQAYRAKIDAIRQSGQLGGQIEGQDMNQQSMNANILNAYNQRMTQAAQDWQYNRANMANQAQQYNLGQAQSAANKNTDQANQYALAERARRDQLQGQAYRDQVQGINYQNQNADQRAQWMQGQKQYLNSLRGNQYNDQYRQTAGMNGIGQQQIGMNTQKAQDRNSMIQGIGQAGMGYYQGAQDEDRFARAQDREDARYKMKYGSEDDEE